MGRKPGDRVTALRVFKLLPGVGAVTALKMLNATAELGAAANTVPTKAQAGCRDLAKVLKQVRSDTNGWPQQMETVRAWYQPHLENNYEDWTERTADLNQLQVLAQAFKPRQKFLSDMVLDPPSKGEKDRKPNSDTDYVTLSTIHSCKGREWRAVFVLHVIEGCIPSSRAESSSEIEEERRLLYVAMTRAKQELTLFVPWRASNTRASSSADETSMNQRSRFLLHQLLSRFDVKAALEPADDDMIDGADMKIDLPNRIMSRWQR